MSVAGISSSLFSYLSQSLHSKGHQVRQEFQQLGSDLASGNLSAAQSDFASLQQLQTQASTSTSTSSTASASATSSRTLTQELQQLSQDLQSGNLTAAQQDYSAIQQQASAVAPPTSHHHHHHSSGASATQNTVAQEFQQLGQALQSGDLSSAQQAYTTLQQTFASSSGS